MDTSTMRITVPLFLVICFKCDYVSLFSMLSHDQQYIVGVGAKLTIRCQFIKSEFNLFDNPVLWKKFQYGEESELNILGNIKEPFGSTERFQVSFEQSPPQYTVELTISDMSYTDSGNYTCEVRAPRSAPLGTVHYTIHVKAPVDTIFLVQGNTSVANDVSSVTSITLIENERSSLRCIARGGSPPPEMEISIGREDYTKYFRFDSVPGVSGAIGFRHLQLTSILDIDDFRALAMVDGKRLNCVAHVPGLTKAVSSARLIVNYAPRIQCQAATTRLGERNVRLRCDVTSRPELTSWLWVIDGNGTTVSVGENTDGYWTVVTQIEGVVHLELYIRETTQQSFRVYTLIAGNAVATKYADVSLKHHYLDADPAPHIEDNRPQRRKHASEPRTRSASNSNICISNVAILAVMAVMHAWLV